MYRDFKAVLDGFCPRDPRRNFRERHSYFQTERGGKTDIRDVMDAEKGGRYVDLVAESVERESRSRARSNDIGMTVIDDSYNSNISGTRAAMEVLSNFNGRKIIVTPGMVELGRSQDYANFEFGEKLAKVVDLAVLVGSYNSYRIRDGMLKAGFSLDSIYIAKDLDDAKAYLKKNARAGDVVLFENDLPDKFS